MTTFETILIICICYLLIGNLSLSIPYIKNELEAPPASIAVILFTVFCWPIIYLMLLIIGICALIIEIQDRFGIKNETDEDITSRN